MSQDTHSEEKKEVLSPVVPDEIDGSDITDDEVTPAEIKAKSNPVIDIFEFLELFVIAACLIMFFFSFVARVCTVDGPSMNNTLEDGDKLIVSDLFYTPAQGDIVVFQDLDIKNAATGKPQFENAIIKRVIATGGQQVVLHYQVEGDLNTVTITVDGEVLDEPYRYYDSAPTAWKDRYTGTVSYAVPQGCLFVMGDNTYHSEDSRGVFEFVEEEKVLGKAIFRLGGKGFSSIFNKFGVIG